MRYVITLAFLVLSGPVCTALHAGVRTVTGQVVDAETKEPLPYANIRVKGTTAGTQTNLGGFFILHDAPDSLVVLQASFLGYTTAEVHIGTGEGPQPLVMRLHQSSISLEGVTVTSGQTSFIKTGTTPGVTTISPLQIAALPGVGQKDIFRSLQLLPGISATNDGSSGLHVRGGTPDQNLVLLDGMTVYHVDHFFGFFSAFSPDAIKDVQVYKGAFPAQFGGRLSSVIDMVGRTGDPAAFHGSAGLSLLSANATVEVPLFGASLLVSGRRSYNDILSSGAFGTIYELMTGSEAPQGTSGSGTGKGGGGSVVQQEVPSSSFSDLNAKLSYNISPRIHLAVSYYGSGDTYDLTRGSSITGGAATAGSAALPGRTSTTEQGNNGGSAHMYAQWSDQLFSNAVVAYTRYTSAFSSSTESRVSSSIPRFATNDDNRIDDLSLRFDTEWKPTPTHTVGFGMQSSRSGVTYVLEGADPAGGSRPLLDLNQTGWLHALYLQDTWHPFERWQVTGGVRATQFSETARWYVEPRFSTRYELGRGLSLKGAFGVHHQFVNRIVNENVMEGSRDFWVLADKTLVPGRAVHSIAGASWEDDAYLIDVEGFVKDLDHLVEFTQRYRRQALDPYAFLSGTGRVRGVEALLQKKSGDLTGWISYTLSRSEKQFAELNDGLTFPAETDQTHEFKVVGSLDLGKDWTLSSTFVYATGKPYTAPVSQYALTMLDGTVYSYTHVSDKNVYRLPDYHRLDLGIMKKIRFGRSALTVSASAFNVYDRRNISYYEYNIETQPIIITEVTGLGFLPSLSVQYEF